MNFVYIFHRTVEHTRDDRWQNSLPSSTLSSYFSFLRDLGKVDFLFSLSEYARQLRCDRYQMLFCVIMTHGTEDDVLFCSDGQAVKVDDVIRLFKEVTGKPKVRCSLSQENWNGQLRNVSFYRYTEGSDCVVQCHICMLTKKSHDLYNRKLVVTFAG